MKIADLYTHICEVLGKILRHSLGQGSNKNSFISLCTATDLGDEIVNLILRRPNPDFRVHEPCGPDYLLHHHSLSLPELIICRGGRHINNLWYYSLKFFKG